MNAERWLQVKAVLQAALERPAGARPSYVEEACAGDADLLSEVQDLLRFEGEDGTGFSLPVTRWRDAGQVEDSPAEADPERAGPYRILRRLGEGGMGVVYLAERDDGEYRQQVAVKVVKSGPRSAEFTRRFRRERQVLAELQHPNIARLIDSGTTSTGRLYYVMEYVDGVPVTEYARAHELTVRQRLQLLSPYLRSRHPRARQIDHPWRHQARQHPGRCQRCSQAVGLRAGPRLPRWAR